MKVVYCDKDTNYVSQIFDLDKEPELEPELTEGSFMYCYMVKTELDVDYSYKYNKELDKFEKNEEYIEQEVIVLPSKADEVEKKTLSIEEDLAITQDAVDFLLMSRMNIDTMSINNMKGGIATMAAYFAKRIMRSALTYKEVIAKYPEYKEDIDFILKAEGKGDLIV